MQSGQGPFWHSMITSANFLLKPHRDILYRRAPGAYRARDDAFPCCSQEDVAMTVSQNPLPNTTTSPPPAVAWPAERQCRDRFSDEVAVVRPNPNGPVEAMSTSWPRIFPGL